MLKAEFSKSDVANEIRAKGHHYSVSARKKVTKSAKKRKLE